MKKYLLALPAIAVTIAGFWGVAALTPTSKAYAYSDPAQWNAVCDTQHYSGSTPLPNNASVPNFSNPWEGIYACGPMPQVSGDVYLYENFGVGADLWEWECVELVERYLYLAYQVTPYPADGSQIVSNYNGTGNGVTATPNDGNHGLPGVGDVLSYDGNHTSIVVATPSGSSPYYTVFQENDPSTFASNDVYVYTSGGKQYITSNYEGTINGWLHVSPPAPANIVISSGIGLSSTTPAIGQFFQTSWNVYSNGGQTFNYQALRTIAINNANPSITDTLLQTGSGSLAPGQSANWTSTTNTLFSDCSSCGAGQYTIHAQWENSSGNWYDITPSGGTNPITMTINPGNMTLSGINVSTTNVPFAGSFSANATITNTGGVAMPYNGFDLYVTGPNIDPNQPLILVRTGAGTLQPGASLPISYSTSKFTCEGYCANASYSLAITYDDSTGWHYPIGGTDPVTLAVNNPGINGIFSGHWITGDTPGDKIGFVDTNAIYHLRNSDTTGMANNTFGYGDPTDGTVVMCDWNGTGVKTPGIFRNGTWYIRYSNSTGAADTTFKYGAAGDIPVCGDWTGKGYQSVGVFRNGTWFLRNSNTAGGADITVSYGNPTGDWPVVGRWNGGTVDTIGIVRNNAWYLSLSNTSPSASISFTYGNGYGDIPVVGDWDGNGTTTPGVLRNETTWYLNEANANQAADVAFTYNPTTGGNLVIIPNGITTSANPTLGSSFSASYTVMNTGGSSVNLYGLYLAASGPNGACDLGLDQGNPTNSTIASGATMTYSFSTSNLFSGCSNAVSGTYTLTAKEWVSGQTPDIVWQNLNFDYGSAGQISITVQ